MRDLARPNRSLVRFTALEGGVPLDTNVRSPAAKSAWSAGCIKLTAAVVIGCLICAGVIACLLASRTELAMKSGKAMSKADLLQCKIVDEFKDNCGHRDITEQECIAKGCCYKPVKATGIPWCYITKDNMVPGCIVPRQDKLNCGFKGIQQAQCEAKGCCFANAGTDGIPWCFQKPTKERGKHPKAKPEECAIPSTEKVECGFPGITEPQCVDKGCCYKHSGSPNVPFCYDKWTIVTGEEARLVEECGAVENDRVECGFDGISETECRQRGCCYERTGDANVPFCFRKTARKYHEGDAVVAEECVVPDNERFDCGHEGMTADECKAKGCCYAVTDTVGAPFCFYRQVTEAGGVIRPSKNKTEEAGVVAKPKKSTTAGSGSTIVSIILAVAGVAVCFGACIVFVKQSGCTDDGASRTRCTRLLPEDEKYVQIKEYFRSRWDTTVWPTCKTLVPVPDIRAIYEIENEVHQCVYDARQQELEDEAVKPEGSAGPGNEQRRFHGARIKCGFGGALCEDGACTVCRIVHDGHFGANAIGGALPSISLDTNAYVGGIRFSTWAHTAKGQGLAPGKKPPPLDLRDFVGPGSGNAVFLADVLAGRSQVVYQPTTKVLPEGTHSRVADESTGIDELLIFDEAQAIPRALIVFDD